MAESEEELQSLSMRMKEESKKAGFKLNSKKTMIMVSGPITSWQIEGSKSGRSDSFYFGGVPKSLQMVTATMKLKDTCTLKGKI